MYIYWFTIYLALRTIWFWIDPTLKEATIDSLNPGWILAETSANEWYWGKIKLNEFWLHKNKYKRNSILFVNKQQRILKFKKYLKFNEAHC
jgi:hypothetical protein